MMHSGVDTMIESPAQPDTEPRLILITQGRYSGRSEAALLGYRRINGDYLVIASNEGIRTKPDWYLNLKEEPIVQVEIGDASFHASAYTPTGIDRVRLLAPVREMIRGTDTAIPRKAAVILLRPLG